MGILFEDYGMEMDDGFGRMNIGHVPVYRLRYEKKKLTLSRYKHLIHVERFIHGDRWDELKRHDQQWFEIKRVCREQFGSVDNYLTRRYFFDFPDGVIRFRKISDVLVLKLSLNLV